MNCETANRNATPPAPAIAPGSESIDVRRTAEAIGDGSWVWPSGARGTVDPALEAEVPDFDAPFFQAGLAGYSDAAMRLVARRHGCPFCITEALLDRTLLAGGRGFVKADLGELEDNVPGGEDDHPISGQIMGSDPREMAAAAIKMVEQGRSRSEKQYRQLAYAIPGVHPSTHANARAAVTAGAEAARPGGPGHQSRQHLRLPGGVQVGFWNGSEAAKQRGSEAADAMPPLRLCVSTSLRTFSTIDVNLACPVKKIDRKARGGHWLAEPEGAIAILEAVREAVPKEIACTVKLRRSYDDTPEMAANFERIFEATYRIGYAWATVHARTVEQKYIGPSRWTFLRDLVARHPDKLVFGSGDVWDVESIFRMIAYTGVRAVSVARGCIGNPWIFRQARDLMAGKPPTLPTIAQQREVLLEHFALAMKVNEGMRIRRAEDYTGKTMRKFGIRFAEHHPRREEVRKGFIGVTSLESWRAVVEAHYPIEAS